jgi:hypothetical protein
MPCHVYRAQVTGCLVVTVWLVRVHARWCRSEGKRVYWDLWLVMPVHVEGNSRQTLPDTLSMLSNVLLHTGWCGAGAV